MTSLFEHIVLATDIAATAEIPVMLHPYQVRYLIDRAEKAEADNAALRVQLADRELDLDFEYKAREETEANYEGLKDKTDMESWDKCLALSERVAELELQVSLLTPKYDVHKITGSNSANWNGEGTA